MAPPRAPEASHNRQSQRTRAKQTLSECFPLFRENLSVFHPVRKSSHRFHMFHKSFIEIQLTYRKSHSYNWYDSASFSVFAELYKHHHYLISEHFISPERNPVLFSCHSAALPFPRSPGSPYHTLSSRGLVCSEQLV